MDKDIDKLDKIPVPEGLKERQIKIAKQYVIDKQTKEGFTVNGFCKDRNISTATFYKWMDDYKFSSYINALQGEFITDDERQAYQIVKKRIMQMATSKNASLKELEMFMDAFDYVVQAEKIEAMKKLGINPNNQNANTDTRTVEQKKRILLNRLKGVENE